MVMMVMISGCDAGVLLSGGVGVLMVVMIKVVVGVGADAIIQEVCGVDISG